MKTKGDIINSVFIKHPATQEGDKPVLTLSQALICMGDYADQFKQANEQPKEDEAALGISDVSNNEAVLIESLRNFIRSKHLSAEWENFLKESEVAVCDHPEEARQYNEDNEPDVCEDYSQKFY